LYCRAISSSSYQPILHQGTGSRAVFQTLAAAGAFRFLYFVTMSRL
jgi:hypothetical protein